MKITGELVIYPILVFCIAAPGIAQPGDSNDTFVPGITTEAVTSTSNPSQSYTVYLPSTYVEEQSWPVVFIMDPRGRALPALNKFKNAAEALGYILVSSLNTRSDGPSEPNAEALNAMINDTFKHFSVDTTRLYLAGFSGTARLSWLFGYQLKKYVSGVIGFGAGQANGMVLPAKVRLEGVAFDFYGGSGYHDFNYFEMVQLDELLDQLNFTHRIVFYEGLHAWPDSKVCNDALYWMELMAMKRGLKPKNSTFIDRLLAQKTIEAGQLLNDGNSFRAFNKYLAIVEDFNALENTKRQQRTIDSLKNIFDIQDTKQKLLVLAEDFRAYHRKMGAYFKTFRNSEHPQNTETILRDLSIPSFQKQASVSKNPYRARYARVLLEVVYVRASYYETNTQLKEGNLQKALTLVEVANEIKPRHPRNCLQSARIYTQLEEFNQAFKSLYCLEKQGQLSTGMLNSDSLLKPLAGDNRFEQLLIRLER